MATESLGSEERATVVGGSDDSPDARRARRLGAAYSVLVALTFMLIVLGALVRAHGAGLACPDWPRCFGTWLPAFDMRVAFEWTHRLVAGSIATVFVLLSVVALWHPALRRVAAPPLAAATLLLATQIVLGGLTVLLGLVPWTVTAHLVTGNAFAAALLVTALTLRDAGRAPQRPPIAIGTRATVTTAAGLLLLQLVLGGLVSSTGAGLACPNWPACRGDVWFPTWAGAIGLQLMHRTNAYALVASLALAAWLGRHHPRLARPLVLVLGLSLFQVGVGVTNVLLRIPVEVTALHTAGAAALVLAVVWLVREAWLAPGKRRR